MCLIEANSSLEGQSMTSKSRPQMDNGSKWTKFGDLQLLRPTEIFYHVWRLESLVVSPYFWNGSSHRQISPQVAFRSHNYTSIDPRDCSNDIFGINLRVRIFCPSRSCGETRLGDKAAAAPPPPPAARRQESLQGWEIRQQGQRRQRSWIPYIEK